MMGNSNAARNRTDGEGRSSGRIQTNLDQMTDAFPVCPLCKAEASYKISGLFKNIVVCDACGAGWTSHEYYGDSRLITLALAKKGSYQELKPLLDQYRSVKFWKHFEFNRMENDQIEDLLGLYTGTDPDERVESKQKLADADELGQIEIRDIASGVQPSDWRLSALIYLGTLQNEDDLPLLIQSLYEDEGKYTWELINVFLMLAKDAGFDQAVPPIIQVLVENEYPALRARAAEVLGEIPGDSRVIEALANSLHDTGHLPQEQIQTGSWEGLIVAAAKSKPHRIVREFALDSLIQIGDTAAVEAVIDFELTSGFGSSIEKEAEKLRVFGTALIDPLIKGLADENQRIRARAAGFLCFLGTAEAVDPLINCLADEIVLVRSNAAYALGVIGDPRAVEPLKELRNDPEEKVKGAADLALKKLNTI